MGIPAGVNHPAGGSDPAGAAARRWEAGIRYLLLRGSEDPALRAMLGLDAQDEFLGLLTSRSEPIVVRARERLPLTALRHQPELDPRGLTQVAELVARLTLSEIVQPIAELDAAVYTVTEMITGYLRVREPDRAGVRATDPLG